MRWRRAGIGPGRRCLANAMAGGVGNARAIRIARGLRRWITDAAEAFGLLVPSFAGAEASHPPAFGAGVLGLNPAVPVERPDPLAATGAGWTRRGGWRWALAAVGMVEVALVAGLPVRVGAGAFGAAVAGDQAPAEGPAPAHDRLPLATFAACPAAAVAGGRGRGPRLGAAGVPGGIGAGGR